MVKIYLETGLHIVIVSRNTKNIATHLLMLTKACLPNELMEVKYSTKPSYADYSERATKHSCFSPDELTTRAKGPDVSVFII